MHVGAGNSQSWLRGIAVGTSALLITSRVRLDCIFDCASALAATIMSQPITASASPAAIRAE